MKVTRPVLELFKMAVYFPDSPHNLLQKIKYFAVPSDKSILKKEAEEINSTIPSTEVRRMRSVAENVLAVNVGKGQLKCVGRRAETRFRLSAKRLSPFKSAGASAQSTTGNRGVRISGSNAGYTMFRGNVKSHISAGVYS